jgi:hypothetical protein
MTTINIDTINEERRKRRLPPLTNKQLKQAMAQRRETPRNEPSDSDDGLVDFLIGYTTGIPMPSAGGIIGAALHQPASSSEAHASEPSPSGGGSSGGGGASADISDSQPESSSPSSSSSSDSGGGDGGGGGGGGGD